MATSGSYDFTLTRDTLIKAALTHLKVIDQDGTPSSPQVNSASVALNAMVKAWRVDGVFLWSFEEATAVMVPSTIVVGTDGNDYQCIRAHTSTAANRPITGADWTSYWKATGGTGAGAAWVVTTAYVCIAENALPADTIGVERVYLRNSSHLDIKLTPMTRDEYFALGNKTTKGTPSMYWFSRELGQSKLYLWPVPEDGATDVIHYDAVKKTQDFDGANDNPDFPEEWFEALYLGLASKLSMGYNIPVGERRELRAEAEIAKSIASGGDIENTSLQISPAR